MMLGKKKNFISFVLVFVLLLSVTVVSASAKYGESSTSEDVNSSRSAIEGIQVNSSGETFGSELAATSYEDRPDLIAATGVDGTEGYVRKTDLDGEMPSSPEEAVKLMHSPEYLYTARVVPLYDSEGKKVIGEFRIDPPRGEDMEVFVEDGIEKVIKKGEPRTLSAEEKKWLNER